MTDQNAVNLRQKLEDHIVSTLKEKLIHQEVTGDRAKEIARIVLEMIPKDITYEQLWQVIPQLDDKMSELAEVVHDMLLEYDERLKAEVIPRIRALIKQ